ncbi:MAG: hypothetical protein AAF639_26780 [Chloroflexota bacterium]
MTTVQDAIDTLYARPAMYLSSYQNQLDAASLFTAFLSAVFECDEIKTPSFVYLATAGSMFSMQAVGSSLQTDADGISPTLSSLFDIAQFRTPFWDNNDALGYLRPIVWFSDYCLVEMTMGDEVIRQSFVRGAPKATQSTRFVHGSVPSISFSFTLPTQPFHETILDCVRLKRVLTLWEEEYQQEMNSTFEQDLTFEQQWNQQSKFHHSVRLVPVGEDRQSDIAELGVEEMMAEPLRELVPA